MEDRLLFTETNVVRFDVNSTASGFRDRMRDAISRGDLPEWAGWLGAGWISGSWTGCNDSRFSAVWKVEHADAVRAWLLKELA